jgi:hypothetical protein
MAVADIRVLRQVMRERLLTVTGVTAPMIAPENVKFLPPDHPLPGSVATWIRETVFLLQERHVATQRLEARGRAQFDVMVEAGRGTEIAEDLAKLIANAFEPGQVIVSQGIRVILERTERFTGRTDAGIWWVLPVSIFWRYFTATAA